MAPIRHSESDTAQSDSRITHGTIKAPASALAAIEGQIRVVILIVRYPRVPWHCKALAAGTVAYNLSPVTLIPDWIPVIGILDNLLVLGLGIWLVEKLSPPDVLSECRWRAAAAAGRQETAAWRTATMGAIAVLTVKIIAALIFSGLALMLLRSTPIRGFLPGG